jgi:hypothetical protein
MDGQKKYFWITRKRLRNNIFFFFVFENLSYQK